MVFLEGLVIHQGQMLLYYGTADSKIAVARAPISSALHDNAQNQVLPPPLIKLPAVPVAPSNTETRGELFDEGKLVPVPLFESTSQPSVHAPKEDAQPDPPIVSLPSETRSWRALLGCFLCTGGAAALVLWMRARQRSKALRRRNLPCVPCLSLQAKVDREL